MQRKVINVNKNNIAVCNDGSVWKLKYVDITGCDSKESEYLTEWVRLEDVPQNNAMTGASNHDRDYEDIPRCANIRSDGAWNIGVVDDE